MHKQPLMVQADLLHKWNRVAWVTECLILIQTQVPQNNKILSGAWSLQGAFLSRMPNA